MRTIIVGTRQSALALTQTGQVIDRLRELCAEHGIACDFAVKKIVTKGDRILDVQLSKVGGKGLFVKEIEQALLTGEIDIAVHSMKDVPAERQPGLIIGAVPQREDARDCLVTRGGIAFAELPRGARIGTSSLRRTAQLKAARPDLQVDWIRGNIDTRLRKLEDGFSAVVLAAAGLHRMGWGARISDYLPPELCLPAVGQGALGIECRESDEFVRKVLALIHDEATGRAVAAERAFLQRLNGGCHVPIGAHAVLKPSGPAAAGEADIELTGMVGNPDGTGMLKETMTGTDPEALGFALADRLIERGAGPILAAARAAGNG